VTHVKSWQACAAAAAAALIAVVLSAAADEPEQPEHPDHDYANQTPYGTPKASVKAAPDGFEMFFLETVSRHGARSLTSDNPERDALQIWKRASRQGGLTERGEKFAIDLAQFQEAERKIGGYGRLSGLGREELQGIGKRHGEMYANFFDGLDNRDEKIASVTSGVIRTEQSAEAMHEGLAAAGLALETELAPFTEAEDMLHFSNDASDAGEAMTEEVLDRDELRGHAKDVLRTIYVPEFIPSIKDPLEAALDIYKLYQTAPGMAEETDITFARYVPQDAREPLSYATDVETFYQYGPGVEGETNTVDNAWPLLEDFFKTLDERIAGSNTAVVYRFAHGETTMPFAALIKAPGSEEPTSEGQRFTRSTNPWRGAIAGRLAGSIEWAAYRNDAGKVLVTMRYNEEPVQFHDGCTPYEDDSYFYTVDDLKGCLG
jgi:hypothetical protein